MQMGRAAFQTRCALGTKYRNVSDPELLTHGVDAQEVPHFLTVDSGKGHSSRFLHRVRRPQRVTQKSGF